MVGTTDGGKKFSIFDSGRVWRVTDLHANFESTAVGRVLLGIVHSYVIVIL